MISGFRIISLQNLSIASLAIALVSIPYSVKVCHAALITYLITWMLEGRWIEKFSIIRSNTILKLLIAFAVAQLTGVFYSQNVLQAWFFMEKKFFLFTVPIAIATTTLNERHFYRLLYLFVASGLMAAIICLVYAGWNTWLFIENGLVLQDISYLDSAQFGLLNSAHPTPWLFFSYVSLADGINIHPTYLSLYLAFCVLFLVNEIFSENRSSGKYKTAYWIAVAFLSCVIILLSSRVVIIFTIAIFLAICCHTLFIRKRAVIFMSTSALMFFVVALLWVNPVSRYRNLQELANSSLLIQPNNTYNTSAEIRASLWWIGWKTFQRSNIFVGTGGGDVNDEMKRTSEHYSVRNIMASFDPHNQYLYVLIGNGVVGLVIFVTLLGLSSIHAFQSKNYFVLGFLFLFAALCVTESALELQKGIVFFALLFPLLVFHHNRDSQKLTTFK